MQSDDEDVERQELSHIAGRSTKWYNHFGKSLVITIKFDLYVSYVPVVSLLGGYVHVCILENRVPTCSRRCIQQY